MAFDFLGTFTKSQFDRFAVWAKNQVSLIDARIAHLTAEKARIGNLAFAFDAGGIPTNIHGDFPTTYCGKLFAAYEALGGDAFYDLQVRNQGQPVFRVAGDEATESQLMSNGEVLGTAGLSDAESAEMVRQMRVWMAETTAYRRDALERKIKRALDYADQLQTEIDLLTTMKADATTGGSLSATIQDVTGLITDRQYMAASNDSKTPDPHGKMAKAPFAAYMPGGGGKGVQADSYERTLDGPVTPSTEDPA